MTLVDNRLGFGANILKRKRDEYKVRDDIIYNDLHIYGESESPDCPQDGEGGFCHKYHKMAFFASVGIYDGKNLHISKAS